MKMTDAEIDAMPAGREMDEAVAKAVGWINAPCLKEIGYALEALQAFVDARPGWWYILSSHPTGRRMDAEIFHEKRCFIGQDRTPGLPGLALAICRAVLKAART